MKNKGYSAPVTTPVHKENYTASRTSDSGIYKSISNQPAPLHNYLLPSEPLIPESFQRIREKLRSSIADTPKYHPIWHKRLEINGDKLVRTPYFLAGELTTVDNRKLPYPKWCHTTIKNEYGFTEDFTIFTKEEWDAFTISEQSSIQFHHDDLVKNEELKSTPKVKKEKAGRPYFANNKEYNTLDEVVIPPEIFKSYRADLAKIHHLPKDQVIKTTKLLHCFNTHLESASSFVTQHGVKAFNSPVTDTGKSVHIPNLDRFKGDKDDYYQEQSNRFDAEILAEGSDVCILTITNPIADDDFIGDHLMKLKKVVEIIRDELDKCYKGSSHKLTYSNNKNGYAHAHLMVNRAISPGYEKHLTDVYMNNCKGASKYGIRFSNNKNPANVLPFDVPVQNTIEGGFRYFKKNLFPIPTTEHEAISLFLADAAIWNASRDKDSTVVQKLYMRGPISQKVKMSMRPEPKSDVNVYEMVELTKSSGNTETLFDIAFNELPKRKVRKLVNYLLNDCPEIYAFYLNKGVTDPVEMVKAHWIAHYAASINKRIKEASEINELQKMVRELNIFEQHIYEIHYQNWICSGLTKLEAMKNAYDRTFDPKWDKKHIEWAASFSKLSGLEVPDEYHEYVPVQVFRPKFIGPNVNLSPTTTADTPKISIAQPSKDITIPHINPLPINFTYSRLYVVNDVEAL